MRKAIFIPILSLIILMQINSPSSSSSFGVTKAIKKKVETLKEKKLEDKNNSQIPDTTTPPDTDPPDVDLPKTTDEKVESLISKMTLDEKIGQMVLTDSASLYGRETDIKTYFLGAVLSGGDSDPSTSNSPADWANQNDAFQTYASQTRLAIPLLYGIDAVHGNSNVYGAVIFPHNIGLGCIQNTALIEQAAQVTAEEMTGTGTLWTYAPAVPVARDERWGRTYESYSENPDTVTLCGAAQIKGLQGTDLSKRPNVLACAKHYAGDGGTTGGHDQGDTQLSETEFRALHIKPYEEAIKAGIKTIMVSYSSWNGQKSHGNSYLLTTILKNELGFSGIIVSDWDAIYQLPGNAATDIQTAINAGIDIVMLSGGYTTFISTMKTLINEGKITQSRVDDAVRRILKVKYELGLFESALADRNYLSLIGSQAHREVARSCVRESLVLLKNNSVLPVSKNISKIAVAGKNADDLGNQCGGWTISWQGSSGTTTQGTTILQAIRNTVSAQTTVTYSKDGTNVAGADIGIVVIGETPYAEGIGDAQNLALDNEDLSTITNVKNTGIPMVIILVSGRPMIIDTALSQANAFVAAWLPGTEGQGIADVLFGDYPFRGKLSFTWPKSMNQIPINYGDSTYDPLFPFGYGLTN